MLRVICNQFRKPLDLTVFSSGFCTKVPIPRRNYREINDVKIVGTLISDSFAMQSGTKALTVRTRDSPTTHSNHNVHLNTETSFTAGQRVYIVGKLKSNPIRTSDGKLVTSSVVKAVQLFVLENENASIDSTTQGDQNRVELLANIASEVSNKADHSTFAVATHFKKFEDGIETDATTFHRVFIYDAGLRQYIQEKLKKSDRILLNGRIAHMTSTGEDGKRLYSGFIIADSINRVAKRLSDNIVTNETNETNEVKAEN